MPKKVARSVLFRRIKKICHNLWSKVVRARDGRCVLCGNSETLQAHHWIVHAAGSLLTRFLPENGVTLCYACHIFKVHQRADSELLDRIKEHMTKHLDWPRYEEIKAMGHCPNELTLEDLQRKAEELRSMLPGERSVSIIRD